MAVPGRKNTRNHKPNFSRTRDRRDVPDTPLLERVQKWILHNSTECLHGPEEVDYGPDELVVLVVMRDGRPYVRSFVEHYRSLGAKHVVFLDNGSTDGTVAVLREYENVTVLRTRLPFNRYGISMRQYLVDRFGRNRWTLSVDIDELFSYPYADVVSLRALLRYLNASSYTAVAANMLDMFPEKPLTDVAGEEDEPLKEVHRFYDISNVRSQDYRLVGDIGNVLSNPEVAIFRDGIRQTLFNIPTLLIKHPLVFLDDKLKPMDLSEHWVSSAHVADFTGVLLHYKLMDRLYGMVRREIRARNYPNRWGKYDNYLRILDESSSLRIKTETSRELGSVNELVSSGFMVISRRYMEFVEEEGRRNGHPPELHSGRLLEALLGSIDEIKEYRRRFDDVWQELGIEQLRNSERAAHRRTREIQQQLDGSRIQARQLQTNLETTRRRVDRLQQELEDMRASRGWRLLDGLNRIRRKVFRRK